MNGFQRPTDALNVCVLLGIRIYTPQNVGIPTSGGSLNRCHQHRLYFEKVKLNKQNILYIDRDRVRECEGENKRKKEGRKKTSSCVLILILFFSLNGKSTKPRKTNNEYVRNVYEQAKARSHVQTSIEAIFMLNVFYGKYIGYMTLVVIL